MKLEADIEGAVVKWAEANGISHLKLNVQGRVGWPDHMFIKRGMCVFVEFKRPGQRQRPIQEYIANLLRQDGMEVQLHDNVEKACEALARVLLKTR